MGHDIWTGMVTKVDGLKLDTASEGVGANWSPEKRGRALLFIFTLANNPHTSWKSKAQIWSALQEFRE